MSDVDEGVFEWNGEMVDREMLKEHRAAGVLWLAGAWISEK